MVVTVSKSTCIYPRSQGVQLTTWHHLLLRFRMNGAVSPPPSMSSWHVEGQFYLYLVFLPQNTTYQVNILYHDSCFFYICIKGSLFLWSENRRTFDYYYYYYYCHHHHHHHHYYYYYYYHLNNVNSDVLTHLFLYIFWVLFIHLNLQKKYWLFPWCWHNLHWGDSTQCLALMCFNTLLHGPTLLVPAMHDWTYDYNIFPIRWCGSNLECDRLVWSARWCGFVN